MREQAYLIPLNGTMMLSQSNLRSRIPLRYSEAPGHVERTRVTPMIAPPITAIQRLSTTGTIA